MTEVVIYLFIGLVSCWYTARAAWQEAEEADEIFEVDNEIAAMLALVVLFWPVVLLLFLWSGWMKLLGATKTRQYRILELERSVDELDTDEEDRQ